MKSTGEITLIDSKLPDFFIISLSVVTKYVQFSLTAHATCKASFDFSPLSNRISATEIICSVSKVWATAYFFQLFIVSFLSKKGFTAFSKSSIFGKTPNVNDSSFRLQVSGFRFQVTGFRLQVTGFRFQVSGYRFQVTGFRLQVSGSEFKV
jgi:hypothetical protein